jgi:hypothetical protein
MTNAAIYAFCYERQAGRTFIASRISRCVDIETDELILGIPEFLLNAYKNTTYGKLESLREEHGDELAALVYVSKIDGRSSKMEKEIIVSYLLEVAVTSELSSNEILQDLRNEEILSKTQFHRCVGRLSRQNNFDREAFVNATKAIVYPSKSPRPSAAETLEYIEKKLR